MDVKLLVVRLSEVKWSDQEDESLITYSLGSCIGLTLFDPVARVGGMAHVFLPRSVNRSQGSRKENQVEDAATAAKYADSVVPYLVSKLLELGAKHSRLEAKMAGGAQLMKGVSDSVFDIGTSNLRVLEKSLKDFGIPIVGKDVGGDYGRTMQLFIRDGRVKVVSARHGTKEF